METPVIVRAEHANHPGMCLGWDADGKRYVIKSFGGFQPYRIYEDGSYSKCYGEIAVRDLNRALGIPGY